MAKAPRNDDYKAPPAPPDKVQLRNRETKKIGSYFVVDAREILAAPATIYEPTCDLGKRLLPPAAQETKNAV